MKILDIINTMTYIKRSIKENESYFDEDVLKQFEKTDVIGKQYLEKIQEKTSNDAELSKIIIDREAVTIKIYRISSEIATELRISGKNDKKNQYFKNDTPSKIKTSFNKAFEFIKNCQNLVNSKGDKSELVKFKSNINELYIEASKCNDGIKENSSLQINILQDKSDLYKEWYNELSILRLKIEIKSKIHGFNYRNIYKEISLNKPKKKLTEVKVEYIVEPVNQA